MEMCFISFQDGKFAMSMADETIAVAEDGAWSPECSDAAQMLLVLEMGEFTGMTWRTFGVNDEGASAARECLLQRAGEMGDDFEICARSSCDCPEEYGVRWEKAERFMTRVFGELIESVDPVTLAEALTGRLSSKPRPHLWNMLR